MILNLITPVLDCVLMAASMFWKVGWSLVLGFFLSAVLQVFVAKDRIRRALGRDGVREIALATAAGAASSSCSFASAAVMRSLFKGGAALIPSLAFLFASTNLVVELGLVLWLLLGWQFAAAEWVGGIVLIAILAVLVKATYPRALVEQARGWSEPGRAMPPAQPSWRAVARSFAGEWRMLRKDLLIGFLVAGALSVLVPGEVWRGLFLTSAPDAVRVPLNALVGPVIAVLSFVCSIGNVPMAAVLWMHGMSFGGVLSFLFADLIVLPLVGIYRRYYGPRFTSYIVAVFYAAMVLAAIVVDVGFSAAGLVPVARPHAMGEMADFAIDYTFWLNLAFGALAAYLFWLARRNPVGAAAAPSCCGHHA
ncbi:permease [Roseiterribacter gracilis]